MSDSDDDISDSGEGLWLKHGPGGDGSIALKHTQANQHGKGDLIWVHRATGAKYNRPGAAIEEAKPETKTPAPMRKFLPTWKRPSPEMPKGRPWLIWSAAFLCMSCSVCAIHGMENEWVPGAVDGHPHGAFFKEGPSLKRIKEHETSADHAAASEIDQSLQPQIGPVLREALDAYDEQMVKLFMTAYTIAKEDMALVKMMPLSQLLHLIGTKLDKVGHHYQNRDAAREFIECLAAELRADHVEDLIMSPMIALMLDETTDKSTQEQLIIFTRLIKDGRSILRYAGLVEVDSIS